MRSYRRLCTDLLAFALRLRKTPKKSQLGNCLTKAVRPVPQKGPLAPNKVGRIAQHVRKRERDGKEEWMG